MRRLRLHRIVLPHAGNGADASRSRVKTDYAYFDSLRKVGERAAQRFLAAHFDAIGERATLDLRQATEAERV